MKKKYNRSFYRGAKTVNAVIREKFSPNPTESLHIFGTVGKIIGFIVNKMITKPVHLLSFYLTGLAYNKKTEKPYKGSAIYTIISIALMVLCSITVGTLVTLFK